jgi:carboxylesterase
MNIQTIPTAEPFLFKGGPIGCLLVHGFTGTPKEMRWMGETLALQGYTVLGVRLAGHATKPEDMLRTRWQDWLASVEDGWHLLAGSCEKIFVVGLSMGGILSLILAADFPVSGVIAMATPHHLPKDPRLPFIKPLSILQRFNPKAAPDWFDIAAYKDHISYPEDPTRSYAELRDLISVMQAALARISAPALLIYSKDDKTVSPGEQHMEMIFAALGSTDKQTLVIEGSGHVLARDAKRDQVFEAAQQFIRRVLQGEECAEI